MDHLGINSTNAISAIITGDPERVKLIASILGDGSEISTRRGFVCWDSIDALGQPLLLVSTGIGAPSTAIVIEELYELGIQNIIRIGTCGAIQPEVKPYQIVVPEGCVRDEGTSAQYVDSSYPAVPDFELTHALLEALKNNSIPYHSGIVHCKDAYYLEHSNRQLDSESARLYWNKLQKAGVVASEMESSILFVLARLRKIRASSILVAVESKNNQKSLISVFKKVILSSSLAISTIPVNRNDSKPEICRQSFLEE